MSQPTPLDQAEPIAVARTVAELRQAVAEARRMGRTVGLVPTMGALHSGHAALIEAARDAAGFVVVSIFVNPTQFGPTEDLAKYPRTWDADLATCREAGADLVFAPEVAEVYPTGTLATSVEVPDLGTILEGASRPGHFRGVATVVLKLLNMAGPDLAFFGAKDYQQQLVIRRMVRDLDVPVEIRTQPTVRAADGLALSSRNRYLDDAQRAAAPVLHRALLIARGAVLAGERDPERVRRLLLETLESEPLAQVETVDVVDATTLRPITAIGPGHPAVALLAVRVGPARLIDNMVLDA